MTNVNGNRTREWNGGGLDPVLRTSQEEPGALRAPAVSYGLQTDIRANHAVWPHEGFLQQTASNHRCISTSPMDTAAWVKPRWLKRTLPRGKMPLVRSRTMATER